MRAKIMLLTGSNQDERNAGYAEAILTDISAAFDHVFSLMREKIGEKSEKAHGEALTDQAVAACQQCAAVFVCDAESKGVQELYDDLNLPLRIRALSVPEAACGRHEAPIALAVGEVLSLDEDTLRRAASSAFSFAQEEDLRLCSIAPTGASKEDWEAVLRAQEAMNSQAAICPLSAPDAIRAMITAPERAGLMLCPPYAGSILLAAGTALSSHPELTHDLAFEDQTGVYAPLLSPDTQDQAPFAAALSVAKMLRYSLRLQREAACVEAAVKNVLAAGWHIRQQENDPDEHAADGEAILSLICQQIDMAGELMSHSGLK